MAKRFEGWQPQTVYGFVVYTHPEFEGCILLNRWNGTTKVYAVPFTGRLSDLTAATPIYTEEGHGSDGKEALERAMLFVELMPQPEDLAKDEEEAEYDGFSDYAPWEEKWDEDY